jgi:hypothetical protein
VVTGLLLLQLLLPLLLPVRRGWPARLMQLLLPLQAQPGRWQAQYVQKLE